MKRILALLSFLLLMQYASAQKPPHLVPMTISEMVPGDDDVNDYLRFIECRNSEKTVGYLVEPKDDWFFLGQRGEVCHNIGLHEVQRAETLFTTVMDKRADSAQQIHRTFTAPRFYQYIRQYVFCRTDEGDTCVRITCVMPSMFGSRPAYQYIDGVCDGDDNYWKADLNLTRGRLLDYSVNGPTYYYVEGRNDEPCGLYEKTLFAKDWSLDAKDCDFKQLPEAVKKATLSLTDTTKISGCQHFSHYYTWKYRMKKTRMKKHKVGDHYRIFTDSISHGFDAQGRHVYVGNEEYLGRLDPTYLSYIPEIDTMMVAIRLDLSRRGRNFEKYGYIQWAEQVDNHYVLAVVYDPPVPADFLTAYYTFDRYGRIEGVSLWQQ